MAGQLKNAVVVLVLITVAKRFIAAEEDTATDAPTAHGEENTASALQEASQEPEETTRRNGQFAGKYPVELCNPFYEFWKEHHTVWTLRTSDLPGNMCEREQRKDLNGTGVTLTKTYHSSGTTISKDYYWTFGEDDAMYLHYSGCFELQKVKICTEQIIKEVLEYESSTNNCSVVRNEEWYYRSAASKEAYNASCKKDNDTWCMCNDTQREDKPYLCRNRPFHKLVVYDEPTENVPEDCKAQYDTKRKLYREDDSEVYTKDCK